MTMTCADAESLLQDRLDGPLGPDDAASLAAHLGGCAACRDLDADLALIHEASAQLDRPIVPAHAWPALAAQLEKEGLMRPPSASAAVTPKSPWITYAWMAVAATLLAGIGAALVWRAGERVAPPVREAAAPAPGTPGNAAARKAVEAIEIELRLAAEHYEKAIASLEALAAEDRTRLDPAVAQVVERNLVLIDRAIADSRTALQGQPGSLLAQESLFDAYRRKVSLLQDLIAMASEAKRTGTDGGPTRDRSRS
jgi:hypothetical protein